MSMHKLVIMGMAAVIAQAYHPAFAEDTSRTAAALPEPLPEWGEPTPPSPEMPQAPVMDGAPGLTENFGIGQPATEDEISAIDIDIMPDGRGLPDGSGTYAQGEEIYAMRCAACHGENLEGIKELGAPPLIGGRDTLRDEKPLKTVESYWPYASTLFDYVHRAMPMNEPGSLTNDEVYAVSAYILGRAGIIDQDASLDKESMSQVKMPNAEGFVDDPRPEKF